MEAITFDNQVAIVTGAGHGLGRTYAIELARRGCRVVVNDLGVDRSGTGSGPAAEAVVAAISDAGGEAVANMDSVATPDGGNAIVEAAMQSFGRLDIVINNAGFLRDKSFHNMTLQQLDEILDVHLRGAFYVSQPAYKIMREAGYGRFLFTTSATGLFGNFGQANYSAAKAGVVGLSNAIAIEGARKNILSNAIAPIARTRLTEELIGSTADALNPELVTPLALYLCSSDSDITHEVYSAGGGLYSRAFTAVTDGWFAGKDARPTVEDVAEHLDEIRDTSSFMIPSGAADDVSRADQYLA